MPQNLNPANPVAVMPKQLCKSFQEDLRMEALMNQYPDGSSDRLALALNVRHYFRMLAGLNGTDWADMRQFYMLWSARPSTFTTCGKPSRWAATTRPETIPSGATPSSSTANGADTYNIARTDVALQLREVV